MTRATMDDAGRIEIPEEVRAQLGLEPGDAVEMTCDGDLLLVWKPARATPREPLEVRLERMREIVRRAIGPTSGHEVDDFIAERHREAERE